MDLLNRARRVFAQLKREGGAQEEAGTLAVPKRNSSQADYSHADFKNFVRHDLFLGFLKARGHEVAVAYDVGAYSGEWARWFRRRWPEATLGLFEPLAEMREDLEQVCAEHPNTHYFEIALGATQQTRDFYTWPKASRSSLLDEVHPEWGERIVRKLEVETIDALVASGKSPAPDLIKLDVQGAELEVLRGAESVLPQVQIIIAEVSLYPLYGPANPTVEEVMAYLHARDFALFDIIGFARRPVDHALLQADFIFVRKNHPLRTPAPLVRKHDFDW